MKKKQLKSSKRNKNITRKETIASLDRLATKTRKIEEKINENVLAGEIKRAFKFAKIEDQVRESNVVDKTKSEIDCFLAKIKEDLVKQHGFDFAMEVCSRLKDCKLNYIDIPKSRVKYFNEDIPRISPHDVSDIEVSYDGVTLLDETGMGEVLVGKTKDGVLKDSEKQVRTVDIKLAKIVDDGKCCKKYFRGNDGVCYVETLKSEKFEKIKK